MVPKRDHFTCEKVDKLYFRALRAETAYHYEACRKRGFQINFHYLGSFNMHQMLGTEAFLYIDSIGMQLQRLGIEPTTERIALTRHSY